jgi:hypothetical protein
VQEGIAVNWGFIIPVGTILFFAALHQWPPDGRRWVREDVEEPIEGTDVASLAEAQPPRDHTTRTS